jgi:hypothetical protein
MIARNYIFGRKYGADFLEGLVAYYPLNSNANDLINGYNGTLVNSPTFVSGKVGNGLQITEQNQVVTIPDNNDFSFTNGVNDLPFTISAWLYTTAYSSNSNRFLSKREGSSSLEWLVLINASDISITLHSQNSGAIIKIINCANTTSLNSWNHFVITFNGTTGTCYINGIAQTTSNTVVGGTYVRMNNTTAILRIGSNTSTVTNTAQLGITDEVAIWKNRELNATEILELYNKGNAGLPLI